VRQDEDGADRKARAAMLRQTDEEGQLVELACRIESGPLESVPRRVKSHFVIA